MLPHEGERTKKKDVAVSTLTSSVQTFIMMHHVDVYDEVLCEFGTYLGVVFMPPKSRVLSA